MKQSSCMFLAAVVASSLCMELSCIAESDPKCHNCKPPREKPSNSGETGKVIIANFLNMFAQFLNMVSNPHDKPTLVAGGMGIATSLANIATEACKCVEIGEVSPEEMLLYVSEECAKVHVEVTITKQLTDSIKAQYWKSALLPQETRARYATHAEHSDTLVY